MLRNAVCETLRNRVGFELVSIHCAASNHQYCSKLKRFTDTTTTDVHFIHEEREMLREMPTAPVVVSLGEEKVAGQVADTPKGFAIDLSATLIPPPPTVPPPMSVPPPISIPPPTPIPPAMPIPSPTLIRKICVLGYPCVGKSTICNLFAKGWAPEDYDPTIEEQFEKPFTWKGKNYTLRILDTAGQQEHMRLPRTCMVNFDAFIIVYGADDEKSFDTVRAIHDRIVECFGDTKIPVVVVGNKSDLRSSRVVPRTDGEDLAKQWDSFFIEISAREQSRALQKNNEVKLIFEAAIQAIEVSKGNMLPNGKWIAGRGNNKKCSLQ